MHNKYAPGGTGYFEAKVDFVQQQAKTDGAEFWAGIAKVFENTGLPQSLRIAITKKDRKRAKPVEFFVNHCSNTKCTFMPGHEGVCSFQLVSVKRARK
jgi:hypothetical protein